MNSSRKYGSAAAMALATCTDMRLEDFGQASGQGERAVDGLVYYSSDLLTGLQPVPVVPDSRPLECSIRLRVHVG